MSWEDDDFSLGAEVAPVVEKPKTKSLEDRSYEKHREKALEKKAVLEAEAAVAKAALEKARADAKGTAASKAYIASLEKKVAAAEAAVAAAEKDIHEIAAKEALRRGCKKNAKNGVKQFDYERDYLGIERRGGKVYVTSSYDD